MNAYPGFDPTEREGSRPGAPARRAIRLGLCLVLFAGLAAACGSGKSSGQSGQPGASTASANGPSVSFDLTAFESDGGGYGTSASALEDAGYTDRYQGTDGLDHMKEAYAIIAHGLPAAVDLNQVKTEKPGDISSDAYVLWQPNGRRDTVMPPGNHGERIYELEVDLGPTISGGDAVVWVWYLSRAEGDALDKIDLTATPAVYPTQAYGFQIDKATAAALLDLFWVKGAPPTDSPTDSPTD